MSDETTTTTPPAAAAPVGDAPPGTVPGEVCPTCNNPWVTLERAPRENPEACATCGLVR